MNVPSHQQPRDLRTYKCAQLSAWCALSWLVFAAAPRPSCAAQAGAALMVSAQVTPVARIQMPAEMPPLQVSASDVAVGFVDAPRPVLLRVDSNSRAGFALEVSVLSPAFTAVSLTGFDTEVILDADGGTVVQRWQGGRSRSLELRARFKLAATVQPGLYAWPLQFSARPL
jgi:hypothetical protein